MSDRLWIPEQELWCPRDWHEGIMPMRAPLLGRRNGAATPVSPPNPPDFGSDFRQLIYQPGDQEITVLGTVASPRTYTAGLVDTSRAQHVHTANAPRHGWLVLKAQELGGVTIDGSLTGFNFTTAAGAGAIPQYRIAFVGLNFLNVEIILHRYKYVIFLYCTASFTAHQWNLQYVARGGDNTATSVNDTIKNAMPNPTATPIRLETETDGVSGPTYVYACDIQGGDDCIFDSSLGVTAVVGNRFKDAYHHNIPKTSETSTDGVLYFDPGSNQTVFHSDVYQNEGGFLGLTFTDNDCQGHIELTSVQGNTGGITIARCDVFGSSGAGASITNDATHKLNGSLNDVRWYANGQYVGPGGLVASPTYSADFDVFNGETNPDPTHFTITNLTHAKPAAVGVGNIIANILDDLAAYPNSPYPFVSSWFNDASARANVWRTTAGQTYASYMNILTNIIGLDQ